MSRSTAPLRSPASRRRRAAPGVRLVSSAHEDAGENRSSRPSSATTRPPSEPSGEQVVLLGEHLGRDHEGALVAALHPVEERRERDDGLAGTDVALEQPVHRERCCEVPPRSRRGPAVARR